MRQDPNPQRFDCESIVLPTCMCMCNTLVVDDFFTWKHQFNDNTNDECENQIVRNSRTDVAKRRILV